jgi:hypothetical protein
MKKIIIIFIASFIGIIIFSMVLQKKQREAEYAKRMEEISEEWKREKEERSNKYDTLNHFSYELEELTTEQKMNLKQSMLSRTKYFFVRVDDVRRENKHRIIEFMGNLNYDDFVFYDDNEILKDINKGDFLDIEAKIINITTSNSSSKVLLTIYFEITNLEENHGPVRPWIDQDRPL